ncbi:hypothetical protein METBIDRAFT_151865 [Metschnikowia bicuspidata var. bicuspidata NRRL YB-4993]|uniref:Uncharacterized protein n=1 Tax=Metschnikowia bicuspidata var. bicuspidata NRRL YB-4993 TaxID=869754 RepID=A0A1A0HED7_9ASCO|nr:hypothetical protein METBIDRAFT_151865 [Metschnikowia bicuspidata var. bicuspidata NRRL YB-4993]OBA22350.1 hypothetical protein METBIDRAFT_151865 [Metschnikowia bicuspidata var. bicuspidata NRRL YB-4993]
MYLVNGPHGGPSNGPYNGPHAGPYNPSIKDLILVLIKVPPSDFHDLYTKDHEISPIQTPTETIMWLAWDIVLIAMPSYTDQINHSAQAVAINTN